MGARWSSDANPIIDVDDKIVAPIVVKLDPGDVADVDVESLNSESIVTGGDEYMNAVYAMRMKEVFKPFALLGYLNEQLKRQRKARVKDVILEFFDRHPQYAKMRPHDVEAYINESVSIIHDLALNDKWDGLMLKTVTNNTLCVGFQATFMYFIFISYVAGMRQLKVSLEAAPAHRMVGGVDVAVIERVMEICFSSTTLTLSKDEESLLLVDMIRIRNRGRVFYPPE